MSKLKITAIAFSVLALGGVGIGSALAGPVHTAPKAPAVLTPAAADTDMLQVGDQTTPDVPGTADTAGLLARRRLTLWGPLAPRRPSPSRPVPQTATTGATPTPGAPTSTMWEAPLRSNPPEQSTQKGRPPAGPFPRGPRAASRWSVQLEAIPKAP